MTLQTNNNTTRAERAARRERLAAKRQVELAERKKAANIKAVVSNTTPSDTAPTVNEYTPVILDKTNLSTKQKTYREKLTNKQQQAIAKAARMSENGAWAWLSEKHDTDSVKTVEITTIFAGMERARVDELPFNKFIVAIEKKWPELKNKWLQDHRTIASALVKAKDNEGKQASADCNIVGVHDFKDTTAYGIKKLVTENRQNPILFKTGSELSRIDTVPEEDQVSLTVLTQDQFAATLNAQVPYFKKNGENSVINISAPVDVIKQLYAMPSASMDIPYLSTVTRIPTLTENGKIVQETGYNKDAKVFYAKQRDLDIPFVPNNPTPEQVTASVELIKDMLADFPFDGQSYGENMAPPPPSMVNAIGLLIQPFARPAYAAATPATLITKPAVGTGASLLAAVCQTIVSGKTDVRPPFANSEDEIRKSLYTAVKQQSPYLFYDNLSGMLDSPTLAALLTSTTFTDRELGRSTERTLPVVSGMILTGNNPTFSTELLRRLSMVRLDAKTANPKGRQGFKHPDLIQYVTENRGEIIGAILTIITSWTSNGKPAPVHAPYIASYAGWCHTIGGILENAGFTTFQQNRDQIENLAAGGDEDSIEDLISVWYDARKTVGLAIGVGGDDGLIKLAQDHEIDLPVRKNAKAVDAFDYNPRAFGVFLSEYADRYFRMDDGTEVCLVKGPRDKNGVKWELVPKPK